MFWAGSRSVTESLWGLAPIGKARWGSRDSPYSQRGCGGWPSLPPRQRDSTYSHLRSDEPTRLTRAGPGLIRYRRPHIAAMHTTRCTVSDMPRLRIMGKNPLPYRLLITLSPSQRSLSPRSRRNQVLRQLWSAVSSHSSSPTSSPSQTPSWTLVSWLVMSREW